MKSCTGLYIIGQFYNYGGISDMAHQYAQACELAGIPARLIQTGDVKPEVKAQWKERVERSQHADVGSNPYAIIIDIPTNFRMLEFFNVEKVIGSSIFEGHTIPGEWVNHCALMDEIWVPTEFNMNSFAAGGVNPSLLKKLRLAIDLDFWNADHPNNRTMKNRKSHDPVEFLYSSSLHRRKGLDKLMAAYFREFSHGENVRLTLSCFPIKSGGLTNEPIEDDAGLEKYLTNLGLRFGEINEKAELPKIRAYYKYWTNIELRDLFFRSDAYVSSERADGWALPVMQMMALRKPVGLLNWGGSSEYASSENAHLIPAGPLEPMDSALCRATAWYRGQAWPRISVDDLQACMRAIYNDVISGNQTLAESALNTVRQSYSFEVMGQAIAALVHFQPEICSTTDHTAKVTLRATPYEGTIQHILLSKVRRLMTETNRETTIYAPIQSEASTLRQLSAKQGMRVSIVSDPSQLPSSHGAFPQKNLVLAGTQDDLANLNLSGAFSHVYMLDRLSLVLEQVPMSKPKAPFRKKTAIYLSGGLTVPARKILTGRGLFKSPLFSLFPTENEPKSWDGLERKFPGQIDPSEYEAIFIADEDPRLQRQSYQNAETVFPNSEIITLLPPTAQNNQLPLKDKDIFAKSLPKRWKGANESRLEKAVTLPAATSVKQLAFLVIRLAYFISAKSGVSIKIPAVNHLLNIDDDQLRALCRKYGNETYGDLSTPDFSHISICSEDDIAESITDIDCVNIVWNLSSLPNYQRRLFNEVDNLLVVDVDHLGMRSGFAAASADYFCRSRAEVAELRQKSQRIFARHYQKLKETQKSKVTIFGTGPSLASAFDFDFSDSITIACNTMVKDRKLLDHLRPDIIVASDADFHFGPSRYAQEFRHDLSEVLQQHKCIFVCPEAHAPLLLAHHPELEPYLVAVPVDGTEENFDLLSEFRVRAIDNVLLQFLLPLASTVGEIIQLIGFDGRKKNDVKFWSHNLNTQYSDLMHTIEHSHPGFFFFRDYADYFDRHCHLINEYIRSIEGQEKHVVSLTDSGVPALSLRYRGEASLADE